MSGNMGDIVIEDSTYTKGLDEVTTVVDVYDSAALIGKDFEYLIEQYGVEAVTDLMPKVIRVLEQLEHLAAKSENENEEILQLQAAVKTLKSEKEQRMKERHRYEQDLEQIEEMWRKETKELLQMVSNLQDQNKRLQHRLSENSQGQQDAIEKQVEDCQVIDSLNATVNRQRSQIKGLEREMEEKDVNIEAMQEQVEQLARDNAYLRNASSQSRTQSNSLLAEKSALENTIQEKENQIRNIRDVINEQEQLRNQLENSMQVQLCHVARTLKGVQLRSCIRTFEAKRLIDEKTELQSQIQDLGQQLNKITDIQQQTDMTKVEDKMNLISRMVGELRDQDKPRFTLNELKEVLMERNTLKSQLIEVEEELCFYKNKDNPKPQMLETETSVSNSWQTEELTASSIPDDYSGDVHGPLPKEPYEKLYGKQESGIRKFFERFPIELPETIRVNIIPGELANLHARASSFWDLQASPTRERGVKQEGRPKSAYISKSADNQ